MSNKIVTPPEARSCFDIEQDFIPAINTIKSINDLLRNAVQTEHEQHSFCGKESLGISQETLFALADRCYIEATKAGGLFYELVDKMSNQDAGEVRS